MNCARVPSGVKKLQSDSQVLNEIENTFILGIIKVNNHLQCVQVFSQDVNTAL